MSEETTQVEHNQGRPEVITRDVNVTGIEDLNKLLESMESIDVDQSKNQDKMYALNVTYNGKPSNPYFTLNRIFYFI